MRLRIVIRGRAAAAHARYDDSGKPGVRGTLHTLSNSLSFSLARSRASRASFIGPTKFARVDMHGRLGKCSRTESRGKSIFTGRERKSRFDRTGLTLRNLY